MEFKEPEDIYQYGIMVNEFSDAAKALANGMALGMPQPAVKAIVGEGRYNNLAEKAFQYIIYGPEKMAAAQGKYSGLFGAFYFVHRPELQLSQQAPMLLGKAGCRLQATVNGTAYTIPLQEVNFDFTPGKAGSGTIQSRTKGRIILRKDITVSAEDGSTLILPQGTPLTSPTNSRAWNNESGEPLFQIIDAQGKPLDETDCAFMLWGHIGSMGIKKHGRGTPAFDTIALDGTDDDFNAERHMVEWLKSVKEHNNIDLMPAFNGYVQEASKALNSRPDMLACMAMALQVGQRAKQIVTRNSETARLGARSGEQAYHDYRILEYIAGNENAPGYDKTPGVAKQIAHAADMLDLHIPEPAASAELSTLYAVMDTCDSKLRIARADRFIKYLCWDRIRADFKSSEYIAGGRHTLDEAIHALELIAAKIVAPNPNDSADVQVEVAIMRNAYALIKKNYEERLERGRDKKTSFFGRTHKKTLARIKDFLDVMEECDCDVEKLKIRYVSKASPEGNESPGGFAAKFASQQNRGVTRA